jgi:hypothetical protein
MSKEFTNTFYTFSIRCVENGKGNAFFAKESKQRCHHLGHVLEHV